MKTSELTGAALNWAVNHAERLTGILAPVNYCGKWEHGGPIIEREGISVVQQGDAADWVASVYNHNEDDWYMHTTGPTPLIAAMRCYVASKLGDDINIPEELL
jgi:hypothetical protein